MQNALQNAKTSSPAKVYLMNAGPDTAAEADDLVLHIARVADLAAQCEKEGNPATAVALRRLAETLWGDAFKYSPQENPEK